MYGVSWWSSFICLHVSVIYMLHENMYQLHGNINRLIAIGREERGENCGRKGKD